MESVPDLEVEYRQAATASGVAEDALDRARLRRNRAGNPVSRFLAKVAVSYRSQQVYDTGEHVGMLEELRILDQQSSIRPADKP